jgi:SSS family solute:Na+ symporter
MIRTHSLTFLDLAVVCLYIGGLVVAGILDRRRAKKARDHFLAASSSSWPKIGFALYASTISATSLVGLTGSAYAHGISVFAYEWMAAFVLPVFCAFVLPTYVKSQVFTVPEFLELRYGRFVRTYVSGLGVMLGTFLDASGGLFAGSVLFQMMFPTWPLWEVSTLLAVLAGAFLLAGGLRAVILIESIQGLVLVLSCATIAVFAFQAAGGWHHVMTHVDPAKLRLVMGAGDRSLPWTGLITGVPLIGFYFWCTNQIMVQRVLAARSLDHGRWGSLLGGALKLTNLFLVILPGAAALLLFPGLKQPDQVFAHIVFGLLPPGVTGLILAACLISILSGLSGIYNSTSTLLTIDFVRRFRPDMDDQALILTGRVLIVVLMLVSILWVPQIVRFEDTLWQYLQSVLCYFVPPIAAVFLTGLFIRRVNNAGAGWGLFVGTVASVVLFFGVEVLHLIPLHFLVAAMVIFVVSLAAIAAGTFSAPAPDVGRIAPLMFSKAVWHAESAHLRAVKPWLNYRYLSIGLMAITVAIVVWFW